MTIALRRPAAGTGYPQLLRVPGQSPMRPLLVTMIAIIGYSLVVAIVIQVIVAIEFALSNTAMSFADFYRWSTSFQSPWGLLAAHIGISMLIPVALGFTAFGFYTQPGWVCSVAGRMRWGWLGIALVVSTVLVLVAVILMAWVNNAQLYVRPQAGFIGFVIVILVTTPVQAAAEEFFFRGFLLQAIGSMGRSPWIGIVGSALVFALFHGNQNVALFVDRFAFGVLAGVLVWRTGGLEAAIAAHVLNNVVAFLQATVTTSVAAVRAVQEVTWPVVAWHLGTWVVIAVVLWAVGRWRKVATTVS